MSLLPRLIARLDIKGPNVVKGIQFEGLRVVGNPAQLARKYAEEGAHELLYLDSVASLYGRNQLEGLLTRTTDEVFVPVTVGGGIKSIGDMDRLLRAGADSIAINTAAIKDPDFIRRAADHYGNQAIVVSIEAKRTRGGWECYTDCGREKTGKCVIQWAEEAERLGAGEIFLTSIDQDGTMRGPDLELIKSLAHLGVPLAYGGGIRGQEDIKAAQAAGANAVAIGAALHYGKFHMERM